MKKLKIIFGFLSVFMLLGVILIFVPSSEKKISREDTVFNFRLKTVQGDDCFFVDYKGKVVLINFWATWCTYCLKELPFLQELQNQYKNNNFSIISVLEDPENIDSARIIIEQNNITFPVLLDENKKLFKRFMIRGLPYSVLVNKQGKIEFAHFGYGEKNKPNYKKEISYLVEK